jgi:hypothetical protein
MTIRSKLALFDPPGKMPLQGTGLDFVDDFFDGAGPVELEAVDNAEDIVYDDEELF